MTSIQTNNFIKVINHLTLLLLLMQMASPTVVVVADAVKDMASQKFFEGVWNDAVRNALFRTNTQRRGKHVLKIQATYKTSATNSGQ